MPIIKSAQKKMRQDVVRKERNAALRREVRDEMRTLNSVAATGKKKETQDQLSKVYSVIDKAAKKNIVHKNKAARKKTQANKAASSVLGTKTTAKKTPTKKATAKKAEAKS